MKPKTILTRNFKNLSHENLKNDPRQVDLTDTLNLQLTDVNHSFENVFTKINQTLDLELFSAVLGISIYKGHIYL